MNALKNEYETESSPPVNNPFKSNKSFGMRKRSLEHQRSAESILGSQSTSIYKPKMNLKMGLKGGRYNSMLSEV